MNGPQIWTPPTTPAVTRTATSVVQPEPSPAWWPWAQAALSLVQYTLLFFVGSLWLIAKFFTGVVLTLLNRKVAAAALAVELVAGRRIRGDRTHWLVELARPWRLPQ